MAGQALEIVIVARVGGIGVTSFLSRMLHPTAFFIAIFHLLHHEISDGRFVLQSWIRLSVLVLFARYLSSRSDSGGKPTLVCNMGGKKTPKGVLRVNKMLATARLGPGYHDK